MSEREFGWEDTIQNDSTFEVLPEGDYNFTVKSFERARHNGSEKLPPCNKAVLKIEVSDGAKSTTLDHNLFLHSKTEGMLCAFFNAIGQRQHGQAMKMNWGKVPGARGRCKLGVRKWTGKEGQPMESNQIVRFYESAEVAPEAAATPAYKAGKF